MSSLPRESKKYRFEAPGSVSKNKFPIACIVFMRAQETMDFTELKRLGCSVGLDKSQMFDLFQLAFHTFQNIL